MTKKKEKAPDVEPNPNRALWDRLMHTDPRHTKKVGQRGGFTAIDAHYQVMRATEEWGSCGGDWGFRFTWIPDPDLWIAVVTLWYPDDNGTRCEVSQVGAAPRKDYNNKTDFDAPKKAVTNSLTKTLSYAGMSADVFLGLWDDNVYHAENLERFGLNPAMPPIHPGKPDRIVPRPTDKRGTARERIKHLCGNQCGDKSPLEYFTGLAADLGFPMKTDDMNDDQFDTICAELEAMEAMRTGAGNEPPPTGVFEAIGLKSEPFPSIKKGETAKIPIPDGPREGPPMLAYEDDIPF